MAVPTRSRRILVISNETVEAEVLRDTIAAHARTTQVPVVARAPNSRVRHRLSDEDPARRAAEARLGGALHALRDAGVDDDGGVGDADPMLAIEDALAVFPADELLVATHPEARSNWLAHDLVGRACAPAVVGDCGASAPSRACCARPAHHQGGSAMLAVRGLTLQRRRRETRVHGHAPHLRLSSATPAARRVGGASGLAAGPSGPSGRCRGAWRRCA